jgi:hypothetical protein
MGGPLADHEGDPVSDIVRDYIKAEIAALTRQVPTPVEPFGYGVDLSCVEDLTETMAEVDPFSTRALAEAIYRRLSTPRGALPDDGVYGLDLRSYLNRGTTAAELRDLASQVRAEITKDDRVSSADVTVTVPSSSELNVRIRITPEDPELGPFDLTLAVTSADVLLKALDA